MFFFLSVYANNGYKLPFANVATRLCHEQLTLQNVLCQARCTFMTKKRFVMLAIMEAYIRSFRRQEGTRYIVP